VAAIGNGTGFKQGRDFGAWLGLVPKQESTEDRTILGKISKRGNKYLRTLFVQAAHVVLARRPSAAMQGLWPWIEQASKRLHRNMLAIALANKLARIAWAVLARGRRYQPRAPQALGDNLAAAGLDPRAVDQIVVSHFHPDQINGIKDKDNALIFANAEITVPAAEWTFWMDDANLNAAPANLKLTFRNQRRIFSDIAQRVTRFKPRHCLRLATRPVTPCLRSIPRSVAHGARRYRAASGDLRASSRLAGGVRYRRSSRDHHAQKAV